jgi:hypothetical protein
MLKATLLFLGTILATATYSQAVKLVPHSTLAKILGRMHGEEEDYAITIGRPSFLAAVSRIFYPTRHG